VRPPLPAPRPHRPARRPPPPRPRATTSPTRRPRRRARRPRRARSPVRSRRLRPPRPVAHVASSPRHVRADGRDRGLCRRGQHDRARPEQHALRRLVRAPRERRGRAHRRRCRAARERVLVRRARELRRPGARLHEVHRERGRPELLEQLKAVSRAADVERMSADAWTVPGRRGAVLNAPEGSGQLWVSRVSCPVVACIMHRPMLHESPPLGAVWYPGHANMAAPPHARWHSGARQAPASASSPSTSSPAGPWSTSAAPARAQNPSSPAHAPPQPPTSRKTSPRARDVRAGHPDGPAAGDRARAPARRRRLPPLEQGRDEGPRRRARRQALRLLQGCARLRPRRRSAR
jgi:hypothetical protein